MYDFLLSPVLSPLTPDDAASCLERDFKYRDYRLQYDGPGPEQVYDTTVFINGYVLPVNQIFDNYRYSDPYHLIASLYSQYDREFIRYIKGYFIIIIFRGETIEVYFDHIGLFRAFYAIREGRMYLSASVMLLKKAGMEPDFDDSSLCLQSLFHRVPLNNTIFKGIFKSEYGDTFYIGKNNVTVGKHWKPEDLSDATDAGGSPGINEFAELFRQNFNNFNAYLKPENHCITLTGGKDCRTALAVLLAAGIKPFGLTYGSKESSDAIYAALLSKACGIQHLTVSPPCSREWFKAEAERIIGSFNPEINIHRSHRFYAFAKAAEVCARKTAFYTGYLGGELLAGVFNDDLIFTDFQTLSWKSGTACGLEERLTRYFNKYDKSTIEAIKERLGEMQSMSNRYPRVMKSFYGIFETGIPHHSQDVFLSGRYWDYPYPVFLDREFLEMLFKSRYSFLGAAGRRPDPLHKYNLYAFNMKIQHLLYPELDEIPFGKKGTYNTREYLKGPASWYALRGYRYLTGRGKYPPSFAYGDSYREFIDEALNQVKDSGSPIRDFFDIDRALHSLRQSQGLSSEKFFHRYSNIVMFHLMDQKLKDEI